MKPLPIDPLLSDIVRTVRDHRGAVIEAEPGAGKTTRVPRALLESEGHGASQVIVTEPRRLAARLAADFVAREMDEELGRTVGYSVRFEQVTSQETRLLYVTEGVLLRRLVEDPELSDVRCVVLDEAHERHVGTDLLLALLLRLRKTVRPDLAIVVMSATIEAERVARFIETPRLFSPGRAFPLTIEHANTSDDRPLESRVASAVRTIVDSTPTGDVLVFLPGAREIRLARDRLEPLAEKRDLLVLPLHGDLPMAEQTRAVQPAARRKVILATNVAESSVTVEGVVAVIDSGLGRFASHNPWTGLPTLELRPISRASAAQRAGRAGRLGPGVVHRLYTRGDLERRPEHDAPELLRMDLADPLLLLHGVGATDARALDWLDAPPEAALGAAKDLLRVLDAIDAEGSVSPIGKRMLRLPLPARLARLVVAAEDHGVSDDGCLAASLLSERDIRLGTRAAVGAGPGRRTPSDAALDVPTGPSDVLELMDRFHEAEDGSRSEGRLRRLGLDPRSVGGVRRLYERLSRSSRDRGEAPRSREDADRALRLSLLLAYPDRVARRRSGRSIIMAGGRTAELSPQSAVRSAPLLLALDAEQRGGRTGTVVVRIASAIEPDWLLEHQADRVEATDALEYNADRRRVDRVSRLCLGSVVLDEERGPATPCQQVAELLADAARQIGLPRSEPIEALRARVALLAQHVPELGMRPIDDQAVDAALLELATATIALSDLTPELVSSTLQSRLPEDAKKSLARDIPERITLAGGRSLEVHYEAGKPPWVASRMQDFFGCAEGPTICRGRLPLTLHLLAPNQRAVQVTSDLSGFWQRHYPTLRKELARRYPKHPFPEDGRTATPPAPRRRGHSRTQR